MNPRASTVSTSSTIGSPLTGLCDGSSFGILARGKLGKRRDGAVRGGWADRLFVLTGTNLHYFRLPEPTSQFGEERGHISLSSIGHAVIVPAEEAPYGAVEPGIDSFFLAVYNNNNNRMMFLRAASQEDADLWVKMINESIRIGKRERFQREWSTDGYTELMSIMAGKPVPLKKNSRSNGPKLPPSISYVSVKDTAKSTPYAERVITHGVEIDGDSVIVDLGRVSSTSICRISLSDSSSIELSYATLEARSKEKERIKLEAKRGSTLSATISLQVKATALSPTSRKVLERRKSLKYDVGEKSASPLLLTFLAMVYLVACGIASVTTPVFEGLISVTIMLGVLLSLCNILGYLWTKTGPQTQFTNTSMTDQQVEAVVEQQFSMSIFQVDLYEGANAVPDSKEQQEVEDTTATEDIQVPKRFIDGEKGNYEKAHARYLKTLQWRKENNIDNILEEPQQHFDLIKRHYKQYFHGRSLNNHPVYYEMSGRTDLKSLRQAGLSLDDLLRHYIFSTEYLWRVVEPSESARSITVLDVDGMGLSDVGGDVLDFIKKASAFSGQHYPERSSLIFIINVPGWFSWVWNMIKGFIDPVTREKVHMVKKSNILSELSEHIAVEDIPSDYGGQGCALGESSQEKALYEHVHRILDSH